MHARSTGGLTRDPREVSREIHGRSHAKLTRDELLLDLVVHVTVLMVDTRHTPLTREWEARWSRDGCEMDATLTRGGFGGFGGWGLPQFPHFPLPNPHLPPPKPYFLYRFHSFHHGFHSFHTFHPTTHTFHDLTYGNMKKNI